LNENKYVPVCEQQVVRKAKLTHVSFNPFEPVLLIGDEKGTIHSMKLSPNLRKKIGSEDQAEKIERILLTAMGKTSK
jgi:dynein intermediate chain 1